MNIVDQLLTLARNELETKEYPPGSNNVKYNTAYYGGPVNNPECHWCAVFIWWLFQQCGCGGLYYGGQKTAYVPNLVSWARREGLIVKTPRPGDLVCFEFNARIGADHIGLCESWDGEYVTTIDGNTGTTSEANGGCVMRRRRHKQYISAIIRPKYEEGTELTEEQIRTIVRDEINNFLVELDTAKPDAVWQKEGLARAKAAGITDGSRPMALCTRLEAMIMATNAAKK